MNNTCTLSGQMTAIHSQDELLLCFYAAFDDFHALCIKKTNKTKIFTDIIYRTSQSVCFMFKPLHFVKYKQIYWLNMNALVLQKRAGVFASVL